MLQMLAYPLYLPVREKNMGAKSKNKASSTPDYLFSSFNTTKIIKSQYQ
jgi:hypothetical protein